MLCTHILQGAVSPSCRSPFPHSTAHRSLHCVAPEVCSHRLIVTMLLVLPRYSGRDCSQPSCRLTNGVLCSGQGACTQPNYCTCDPGFSGPDCEVECGDGVVMGSETCDDGASPMRGWRLPELPGHASFWLGDPHIFFTGSWCSTCRKPVLHPNESALTETHHPLSPFTPRHAPACPRPKQR